MMRLEAHACKRAAARPWSPSAAEPVEHGPGANGKGGQPSRNARYRPGCPRSGAGHLILGQSRAGLGGVGLEIPEKGLAHSVASDDSGASGPPNVNGARLGCGDCVHLHR